MVFNSLNIWWALFALAIPVIIHLFLFRRTKKIYFSNVALISQVKDETKSRNRIQHFLILLTRLLLFLFIVLAFMQPVSKESAGSFDKSVIFIDNSYSLSREISNGISGLDAIITNVSDYVKRQSLDHQFIIVTNDFAPFSNHFKSRNEVLDYLTEVDYSPVSRSLSSVISRFKEFDDQLTGFHIHSDFQKSAVGGDIEEDFTRQLFLHTYSAEETSNIFIDSVYLANPFLNLGASNAIIFSVSNSGNRQAKEATFRLLNGDKLVGSQRVSIPGNGNQEVTFDIDFGVLEDAALTLNFEDYPVVFDNSFLLAIPKYDQVKIALVTDIENSYTESIYGNSEFFKIDVLKPTQVNFGSLSTYDLLILEGLSELPSWLNSTTSNVVVIPPVGELDVDSYNNFLKVSLTEVDEDVIANIELSNKEHPFYEALLEDIPERLALPKVKRKLNHKATTNTILSNDIGDPVLTIYSRSRDIYFFSVPFDKTYTGLPEHAIFLPVMYKIAQQSMDGLGVVTNRFDQRLIELSVADASNETVSIQGENIRLVPNHYFQDNRLVVELPPEGIENAFYHLLQDQDTLGLLAFNMPRSESLLDVYQAEELEALFPESSEISILDRNEDYSVEASVESANTIAYWKYAVVLALIFVLIEAILLRRSRAGRES